MAEPLLIRAMRGEDVERAPAWMMRQAGRYQAVRLHLRASGFRWLGVVQANVCLSGRRLRDTTHGVCVGAGVPLESGGRPESEMM